MIVVADTPGEPVIVADVATLAMLRASIERTLRVTPAGPAFDRLAAIEADIRRHISQSLAKLGANRATSRDDGPMLISYAEAADLLGVSTRTIARRVAAGQLTRVGRRIVRPAPEDLT